ncbi:MAG: type I restriction endonuclease subunit R [Akkermansia sp.]|nr:type I restriction endonuclease subunit R [Akkermansia sp.]
MKTPPKYGVIAETSADTVVTEYVPSARKSDQYQSEAELEAEFISMLQGQGYEYLPIHSEGDLLVNLRARLEELNEYRFTDDEWERFFTAVIANQKHGIVEKAALIQEDYVQVLTRDDGTHKNINLIDKKSIHGNRLQVINQYELGKKEGAKYDNRYDVTILVNGLPLVHVELKRRGVNIREAFNQINRYQRDSFWAGSGLFEFVQVFVISNGTNTKYYSNTTRWNTVESAKSGNRHREKTSNSFEFTSYWAKANNDPITDLVDFTRTFFARHTLLNVLTRYCVFTTERQLLVMRPYQIRATECVLDKINIAYNNKYYGTTQGGGYIWHTTGSGKTLTSFKCARLATQLPYIDKVIFVVDRKDLDYQTMKEYDRFEKGCANSNTSVRVLQKQLEKADARIIITTIQKLSTFIKKNPAHDAYKLHTVFIFDECHRSQFGDMHRAIIQKFKNYYMFGFTGTPIFAKNAPKSVKQTVFTTEQTFGDMLHSYIIVDAIRDKNVLPFRIDYIKTMDKEEDVKDEEVWDIDREKPYQAPQRIAKVTEYILDHFNQKTYRGSKTYAFNALTNIGEVASAKNNRIKEIKDKQRISGFNSILAVASIPAARQYYLEFQKQMAEHPEKRLRIATIFSFAPNEEDEDGILGEENPEDTAGLDQGSRDFLESAIRDYNAMFQTNYDTSGEKFQSYYKDVSLRMKNKELDLLIVVNMFLTGFDATTLNTLWVDKMLKSHGLLQAFSRTNRILNSVKAFGNIVCFRPLRKRVDSALALFGDKDAGGVVLLRTFKDYYYGYTDKKGIHQKGYVDMLAELLENYPLSESVIVGEQRQSKFIRLFGAILRMRNLLASFDEFESHDTLPERDLQDYLGRYQDLRDEWNQRHRKGELADIVDDLVFEMELVAQIEINIDYILLLVKKYHDSQCKDEELLVSIKKAVNGSPELRSKKMLIEAFIAGINEVDDITAEWYAFVAKRREEDLLEIIDTENLKDAETRKFLAVSFREGYVKTTGTDIDKLMPPVSRFGGMRAAKKEAVLSKLKEFFERYKGIGSLFTAEPPSTDYDNTEPALPSAAERGQ